MTAINTKYVGGSSGYWGSNPSLFNTSADQLQSTGPGVWLFPRSAGFLDSTGRLGVLGGLAGSRLWLLSPVTCVCLKSPISVSGLSENLSVALAVLFRDLPSGQSVRKS